jgi:hypothetical protein
MTDTQAYCVVEGVEPDSLHCLTHDTTFKRVGIVPASCDQTWITPKRLAATLERLPNSTLTREQVDALLAAGHVQGPYIPTYTTASGEAVSSPSAPEPTPAVRCDAMSDGHYWNCSLQRGHGGDHIAYEMHVPDLQVLARWASPSEVGPPPSAPETAPTSFAAFLDRYPPEEQVRIRAILDEQRRALPRMVSVCGLIREMAARLASALQCDVCDCRMFVGFYEHPTEADDGPICPMCNPAAALHYLRTL